jgi:hypothetical protein
MMTVRFPGKISILSPIVILLSISLIQLSSGDEPEKAVGEVATISKLQQAIEKRLGRPNSVIGVGNCLLHYNLENGDILTLVLADEKVLGIEHTKKVDLNKVIGKKVTLIGVYNGHAKAYDEIVMADGQYFYLQNQNKVSEDGKLVSVTGVLKYFSGTNDPVYSKGPTPQGIPPHYYMESDSVELKVLYPFKFLRPEQIEKSKEKSIDSGDPFK